MGEVARDIRFGCSLQLPAVRLAASALEQVAPGDVLRLDVGTSALSEWRVAGQRLSLAQAMRHGAHRAARIERVLAGGER
jgi:flagellar motor switch protein FliM